MMMSISNGSFLLLDHKLSVSQVHVNSEVKRILTAVVRQAIVNVYREHFYQVNFGPDVRPQVHIVSHDLYCACILESDCAATVAAKVYLRDGGILASAPEPGFFPACPHVCPICGARAFYDPRLSSHHRGIGWQCSMHGASHYWQHQGSLPRPVCPA
jgi:hypothetical protein